METHQQKSLKQPHYSKNPESYRYRSFLKKLGVEATDELVAHLAKLHSQALNKRLLLRAKARVAADERRSRKVESPKACPNCTTPEAEG